MTWILDFNDTPRIKGDDDAYCDHGISLYEFCDECEEAYDEVEAMVDLDER